MVVISRDKIFSWKNFGAVPCHGACLLTSMEEAIHYEQHPFSLCQSSHCSLICTSSDLKVTKEEQDIGFYASFVGATYFLGRTISAVPWGMFADKYGRKPCIVISILSVVVFNTLFGLRTT
ncbi:unnamed protein product [Urochloa humidicola]